MLLPLLNAFLIDANDDFFVGAGVDGAATDVWDECPKTCFGRLGARAEPVLSSDVTLSLRACPNVGADELVVDVGDSWPPPPPPPKLPNPEPELPNPNPAGRPNGIGA